MSLEPWLTGSHRELRPVCRAAVHALELTERDVARWVQGLTREELTASPYGLAPVGFHLLHIVRSLDRLLTYAEGRTLDEAQLRQLAAEADSAQMAASFGDFSTGIASAIARVCALNEADATEIRYVGRARIETTVGGLLVHIADHSQRHAGQVITTAKVLMALRG